jgi:hypothetical protein
LKIRLKQIGGLDNMFHIFISYPRKDLDFAQQIADALTDQAARYSVGLPDNPPHVTEMIIQYAQFHCNIQFLKMVWEVESTVEVGLVRSARLRQAVLRSAFEGRLLV